MEPTPSTTSKASKPAVPYNSNPFTLIFNAFGTFFHTNAGWGVALVALGFVIGLPIPKIDKPADSLPSLGNIDLPTLLIGLSFFLVFVGIFAIAVFVLQVFIGGMFAYVSLKSQKGQAVSFNEAFQAVVQRFRRLLIAQAWAGIKIFLWSLLLIVPGVIAALRYALLPYVIMAEPATEKSVTGSHDRVKAITKGKLMEILGVGFAAGIIPFIGSVLQVAGSGVQYQQLASSFDQKTVRPATHWLNYLALGLIIALILIALLFVALFAAFAQSN